MSPQLNGSHVIGEWLLGSRQADVAFTLGAAFLFAVGRRFLVDTVFQPAGQAVLKRAKAKFENATSKGVTGATIAKWNESCWKVAVYAFFLVLGFVANLGQPWLTDSREYWTMCRGGGQCRWGPQPKGLLLLYCLEMGFYLQAIPFLLYVETRRKDRFENFVHHVATLTLQGYSYWLGLTKVGAMVMLIHDMADVPMELAKLARYSGKQGLAIKLFVVFFLIWLATRVVYFPLVIIRSTLFEAGPGMQMTNIFWEYLPHYQIFNGLLILLFCLHVYWSYLIAQIIIKQFREGDAGDIREAEES